MTGLLEWGIPIAVLVCFTAWCQRRQAQNPPRTPAEAARRELLAQIWPYPQLGVHVRTDGFVYLNTTGRCVGPAAGAEAKVLPARNVTKVNPSTGWAVIYFIDGAHWQQPFALRNLPEAKAQAERFNAQHHHGTVAGVFRRTFNPAAP